MEINWQPEHLHNTVVTLVPLQVSHFNALFEVASDPLIWEQHPNKNRYKKEDFQVYFDGAIQSQGAFVVLDSNTKQPIGSSRFYDWDPVKKTVAIGYTFLARNCWGQFYNKSMKTLMLDYAFTIAEDVVFHIGAQNIRSQKAMEKLGPKKIAEEEIKYFGEDPKLNCIYSISKQEWNAIQNQV
jgi:RimJ/RimL family protein N-acetyltransferase